MNLKIIASVYVIFGGLFLRRFFKNQKKEESIFVKANDDILFKIKQQKAQIKFRQDQLKLYNFLKYNIEDVLIAQPNIAL